MLTKIKDAFEAPVLQTVATREGEPVRGEARGERRTTIG